MAIVLSSAWVGSTMLSAFYCLLTTIYCLPVSPSYLCLHRQFPVLFQSLLNDRSLDLTVQFRTQQQHQARNVEPRQQYDYCAQRSVGGAEAYQEVVQVKP